MKAIRYYQREIVEAADTDNIRNFPDSVFLHTAVNVQPTIQEIKDLKEILEFAAIHAKELDMIKKSVKFSEQLEGILQEGGQKFNFVVEVEIDARNLQRKKNEKIKEFTKD